LAAWLGELLGGAAEGRAVAVVETPTAVSARKPVASVVIVAVSLAVSIFVPMAAVTVVELKIAKLPVGGIWVTVITVWVVARRIGVARPIAVAIVRVARAIAIVRVAVRAVVGPACCKATQEQNGKSNPNDLHMRRPSG
jgi:hypothetical protein